MLAISPFAGQKIKGLQQTPHLVLEIAPAGNQTRASQQNSPHLMTGQALDLDLLIPPRAHDLRQPRRVVALLTCIESAEAAWRASRHTTGRPRARNPCHSQVESKPLSSPTRTAPGAFLSINLAIVSGVVPTLFSQTTSPQANGWASNGFDYFSIPLEKTAYAMQSRFQTGKHIAFSVEQHIERSWNATM